MSRKQSIKKQAEICFDTKMLRAQRKVKLGEFMVTICK